MKACHFVKLESELDGLGGRWEQSSVSSRRSRWLSLNVEICFRSACHGAARWMWALFLLLVFKCYLTGEHAAFKLMRSGRRFVSLFLLPLSPTNTCSCSPFSLKPTLGAGTYTPHNYATQLGVAARRMGGCPKDKADLTVPTSYCKKKKAGSV